MYHFRTRVGTRVEYPFEAPPTSIPEALHLTYLASSDLNLSIVVCKDTNSNGNKGYVQLAQVLCLP